MEATREERTNAELIRRKRELAEKLAAAVEHGSEEDFVACG